MMTARTAAAALLVALAPFAGPGCAASDTGSEPERDVPYVHTPHEVVHRMLEMADVDRDDIVYDLGSGDGRIPIGAVRDFGARKGVGIEIDPELVDESRANAEAAGVSERTRFIAGDLFEVDFSEATVVTLYLFPQINIELRPDILERLEPGSRVVSHHFGMGEWEPDAHDSLGKSQIFMWTVPAEVAGSWRWRIDGEAYRLELHQRFQEVLGELRKGERAARVSGGTVAGRHLRFETSVPGRAGEGRLAFDGRVEDGRIRATVRIDERTTQVVARRAD